MFQKYFMVCDNMRSGYTRLNSEEFLRWSHSLELCNHKRLEFHFLTFDLTHQVKNGRHLPGDLSSKQNNLLASIIISS